MLYNDGLNPIYCTPDTNGSFCELTYDGCNCATCKPGFEFNPDGNGKCIMKDQPTVTRTQPINGCTKYKSKT